MTDGVLFRHKATGRTRVVPRGWSWSLFLMSGFFGIPLFLRGLAVWGSIMCVVGALGVLAAIEPDGVMADRMSLMVSVIYASVSLWLGLQGNAITAEHFRNTGWEEA